MVSGTEFHCHCSGIVRHAASRWVDSEIPIAGKSTMRAGSNNDEGGLEGGSFRELRLLEEVESTSDLSQRRLAANLGIALGVANVLVKSLVKKGYIRATRVSWRRWAYIVTPAGMTRKVQLSANYVDRFLGHYRRVRSLVAETLGVVDMSPESVVAIYGTNELAELMYLSLKQSGVNRIEFLKEAGHGEFLSAPVRPLESIKPDYYVKVMVAYSTGVESRHKKLLALGVTPDCIATLLDPPRAKSGEEQSGARKS